MIARISAAVLFQPVAQLAGGIPHVEKTAQPPVVGFEFGDPRLFVFCHDRSVPFPEARAVRATYQRETGVCRRPADRGDAPHGPPAGSCRHYGVVLETRGDIP